MTGRMNTKNTLALATLAAALIFPLLPFNAFAADSAADAVAALENVVDDLKVVQIEGIVIVRGTVRSRAALKEALERIASLEGARVANMLRFVPMPADEWITSEAERNLSLARGLRGSVLRVSTTGGIVTVSGRVENDIQRDTAAEIVRRIEGVRDVRLAIAPIA